jgi:hypothetical protein
VLKAEHFCMTARGIMKPGTDLVTSRMLGVFRDSAITRQEFMNVTNYVPAGEAGPRGRSAVKRINSYRFKSVWIALANDNRCHHAQGYKPT